MKRIMSPKRGQWNHHYFISAGATGSSYFLKKADYLVHMIIASNVAESEQQIQYYGLWISRHDTQLLPWSRAAGLERVIGIVGAEHHVDGLAQELASAARGVESTRDLARFQQVFAVIGIGLAIRALGAGKEVAQG